MLPLWIPVVLSIGIIYLVAMFIYTRNYSHLSDNLPQTIATLSSDKKSKKEKLQDKKKAKKLAKAKAIQRKSKPSSEEDNLPASDGFVIESKTSVISSALNNSAPASLTAGTAAADDHTEDGTVKIKRKKKKGAKKVKEEAQLPEALTKPNIEAISSVVFKTPFTLIKSAPKRPPRSSTDATVLATRLPKPSEHRLEEDQVSVVDSVASSSRGTKSKIRRQKKKVRDQETEKISAEVFASTEMQETTSEEIQGSGDNNNVSAPSDAVLKKKQEEISSLQKEIARLKKSLENREAELKILHDSLRDYGQLKKENSRLLEMESKYDNLCTTNRLVQEQFTEMVTQRTIERNKRLQLEEEIKVVRKDVEASRDRLENFPKLLHEKETESKIQGENMIRLSQELSQERYSHQSTEETCRRLSSENDALRKEIGQLCQQKDASHHGAQEEVIILQGTCQALQLELKDNKHVLEEKRNLEINLQTGLSAVMERERELRQQCSELQEQLRQTHITQQETQQAFSVENKQQLAEIHRLQECCQRWEAESHAQKSSSAVDMTAVETLEKQLAAALGQVEQSRQTVQQLQEKCKNLEDELAARAVAVGKLQQELEINKVDADRRLVELQNVQKELDTLKHQFMETEHKFREELDFMKLKLEQSVKEYHLLQEKCQSLEKEKQSRPVVDVEAMEKELAFVKLEAVKRSDELVQLQGHCKLLEAEVQSRPQVDVVAALEKDLATVKLEIEQRSELCETLQKQCQSLEEEKNSRPVVNVEAVAKLEKDLSVCQLLAEQRATECQTLQEQCKVLQSEKNARPTVEDVSKLEKQLSATQLEAERHSHECQALREQFKALDAEKNARSAADGETLSNLENVLSQIKSESEQRLQDCQSLREQCQYLQEEKHSLLNAQSESLDRLLSSAKLETEKCLQLERERHAEEILKLLNEKDTSISHYKHLVESTESLLYKIQQSVEEEEEKHQVKLIVAEEERQKLAQRICQLEVLCNQLQSQVSSLPEPLKSSKINETSNGTENGDVIQGQ